MKMNFIKEREMKNIVQNISISIDSYPENVVIYRYEDNDFIFIDLNKHALRCEDIVKSNVIGKKLTEIFPNVKEFGLYDLLLKVHQEGTEEELDTTYYEDNRISGWRHNSIRRLSNGDIIVFYKNLNEYKIIEEKYNRQTQYLDITQKVTNMGSWHWNMLSGEMNWSDQVFRIFGEKVQSFQPRFEDLLSYLSKGDKELLHIVVNESVSSGTSFQFEHHIEHKNSEIRYVRESGQVQYNSEGEAISVIGTVLDITEQKQREEKVSLLNQAVEQTDEMIRITDKNAIITYANEAFTAHTGYRNFELIGQPSSILKSGKHENTFYKVLWDTILAGNTYRGIVVNKKKDNNLYYEEQTITPIFNTNKEIKNFVVTSHDITERVEMEKELQKLATFDSLTSIYNRYKINKEIDSELNRVRRYKDNFSLLMIDIDHFKTVNDQYGHDVGDFVLQEISKVIGQYIRVSDRFGRWGGEEFMLLIPNSSKEESMFIANKLRYVIEKHTFNNSYAITISIGVSIYKDLETKESLLKRVDEALYNAKKGGRNTVRFK